MDLLFLPGYACTSAIWAPLREVLPAHHATTVLDWPRSATPGFHTPADFASWACTALGGRRFDCVVGHSMGGLVALELLASGAASVSHLVLVESFVVPPGPFFRNLVLREESVEAAWIKTMLDLEKPYYSPALAESLRQVDMTANVARLGLPVHALHGDRGCGDLERVRAELGWHAALAERVELSIIPGACHFPMIENPRATAEALCRILS